MKSDANPCEDNHVTSRIYDNDRNQAERLLTLASTVLVPKRQIIHATDTVGPCELSIIATAIRFYRMPPSLKLRALVEDWDIHRIHREMH